MYGYARVSTDGQSLDAQVKQLRAAGAGKVFRETASGARADRAQLRRVLGQLVKGDVLTVTRLDRLARSTRDLLNTLAGTLKESLIPILMIMQLRLPSLTTWMLLRTSPIRRLSDSIVTDGSEMIRCEGRRDFSMSMIDGSG